MSRPVLETTFSRSTSHTLWSARRIEISALRDRGVRVDFVVYDMLPVLHPEWFPPEVPAPHREWLRSVAAIADGLVCISDTVADELPQLARRGVSATVVAP